MKLAAIGNSHIGSLKRAWDRISAEFPARQIVFFAARGDTMQHFRPEGRRLVPTHVQATASIKFTSGGRTEIDFDGFDAVLIYGCDAAPFFVPKRFYSRLAIRRAMEDAATGLYFDLLQMVRTVTDIPVYIGHEPFLATAPRAGAQSLEPYVRGLELFNETVFEPLGARMIAQPADSIVGGNRTDAKYTRGSKRLAVGNHLDDELHPEKDIYHMNEEFGELWLRDFFRHWRPRPA